MSNFPNGAELSILEYAFRTTTPPALTLRIFKSDTTPDEDTVVGDLTEADFTGYAAEVLTRAGWDAAVTDVNGRATISYGSAISWTSTSSQTVYGIYLTENSGNTLIFCERFTDALALTSGIALTYQLIIALSDILDETS